MKINLLLSLVVIVLSLCRQTAWSADESVSGINVDLRPAIVKIQEKLKAGKDKEADLADNMRELDALAAKYKATDREGAAGVFLLKAQLYTEVLNNDAKAKEVLGRLKTEYPATRAAKAADEFLVQMKAMEATKKIQQSLVPGAQFPDFSEKDLAGQPVSIGNLKGKVVLIDFWATWCGPCRAELPNVQAVYQKYHGRGFEVIGISLDQDRAKLDAFLKAKDMTWPQLFDGLGWGNKLAAKYGIQSIPATYLLDGQGKIIAKDLRGDLLEQAVAKALGKK